MGGRRDCDWNCERLHRHGIWKMRPMGVGHPWMVFLLPLSGLLVLGVYHALGEDNNRGTNMVLAAISSDEKITSATAPLAAVASAAKWYT